LVNTRRNGTIGSLTKDTRRKLERLLNISTRPPKKWSMISLLVKLAPQNTPLNSLVPSLDGLNQELNAIPMLWLSAFKEKESDMIVPWISIMTFVTL